MLAFQDSLVYVLNRERHTVGQRTPSSKPSISLSAPDILPLHCTLRRHHPSGREQAGGLLVLEPLPGAPVAVNFSEVGGRTVVLRHGDLLSLGLYYLLLFKEPAQAQPLPAPALARLQALPHSCRMCGAQLRAPGDSRPRQLRLEFEPDVEDALLQRIMTLIEPGGEDHKLTPAFLLCLCVQHSATRLPPGSFGRLLLKIAKAIRETVWVSLFSGGGRGAARGPWGLWLQGDIRVPPRACPHLQPGARCGPAPSRGRPYFLSFGPVSSRPRHVPGNKVLGAPSLRVAGVPVLPADPTAAPLATRWGVGGRTSRSPSVHGTSPRALPGRRPLSLPGSAGRPPGCAHSASPQAPPLPRPLGLTVPSAQQSLRACEVCRAALSGTGRRPWSWRPGGTPWRGRRGHVQ